MAASLYLTSETVGAITVPVVSVICFGPDKVTPGVTRVLTTHGMLRVLEDSQTIDRLLGERPWGRPEFQDRT